MGADNKEYTFTVSKAAEYHNRSRQAVWDKINAARLGKQIGYKHFLTKREVESMEFREPNGKK